MQSDSSTSVQFRALVQSIGCEVPNASKDLLDHFQLRNLYPQTQTDSFVKTRYLKDVRCNPSLFRNDKVDLFPLSTISAPTATAPVSAAQLTRALQLQPGQTELSQAVRGQELPAQLPEAFPGASGTSGQAGPGASAHRQRSKKRKAAP